MQPDIGSLQPRPARPALGRSRALDAASLSGRDFESESVDVQALLRLVLLYDIPAAFSPTTGNALVASGLLNPQP